MELLNMNKESKKYYNDVTQLKYKSCVLEFLAQKIIFSEENKPF